MTDTPTNPFGAAGSALGYHFQCRWALVAFLRRLSQGETVDVAIEKLDDISFESSGTAIELIQTKHHVQTAASLSDSSPDLWKTIRVWSEAVRGGSIRLPGVLLTLVTTTKAPANSVAAMLRPGANRQVTRAGEQLLSIATTSKSSANKDAYDSFLGLPTTERSAIVDSIYVIDQEPGAINLTTEITRLVQFAADEGHLTAFVERLDGWWIDRVVEHLTGASSGVIRGADLRLKLSDLRHSFQPDNLPLDFVAADPPDGTDPEGDMRAFVLQLRLVAANNDRIRFAITDYFRAFAQRSRWLRDDLVHAGELERYERRLIEELERHRATLLDEGSPKSDDEKVNFGKKTLTWVENNARVPIRKHVEEPYVTRGSYHMLANQLRVGWHPDFLERLRTIVVDSSLATP